jgi:hypothetical protein
VGLKTAHDGFGNGQDRASILGLASGSASVAKRKIIFCMATGSAAWTCLGPSYQRLVSIVGELRCDLLIIHESTGRDELLPLKGTAAEIK